MAGRRESASRDFVLAYGQWGRRVARRTRLSRGSVSVGSSWQAPWVAMDHTAVGPAAAGVHTGMVRGRVFGCNIKCLAHENVKRSKRQTKRNERVVWTDRKKGKKVPPLRAERRVTTYTRFQHAEKVRVCISAERMWLPCARILRSEGRIRPCRLVDTCHNRTPREPFSRVRSDTTVAVRTTRPNRRLPVQRSPHTALPPRNQDAGNSKKSTLRNAESA